jgi:hypothetical protein
MAIGLPKNVRQVRSPYQAGRDLATRGASTRFVIAKRRQLSSNDPRTNKAFNKGTHMKLFTRMLAAGSVLVALCLIGPAGCGKKDEKKEDKKSRTAPPAPDGNAAEHKGKKDYVLFAPKGSGAHDYHIRLKIDKDAKTAHATVYDKENEQKKPIDADVITLKILIDKTKIETEIELKCQKAEDEKDKCSHFMGKNDRLATAVEPTKVEMSTTIAKKQFIFVLDTDED